jgi:hypothetical protein
MARGPLLLLSSLGGRLVSMYCWARAAFFPAGALALLTKPSSAHACPTQRETYPAIRAPLLGGVPAPILSRKGRVALLSFVGAARLYAAFTKP